MILHRNDGLNIGEIAWTAGDCLHDENIFGSRERNSDVANGNRHASLDHLVFERKSGQHDIHVNAAGGMSHQQNTRFPCEI